MRADMRKLAVFGVLLTGLGSLLLPANPAIGSIITGGDVQPLFTGTDPWNIAGDLRVGNAATGQMVISGNSKVVDVNAYMGYLAGSEGNVLIMDPNSLWQNSIGLFVGGSRTQAGGTALLRLMAGRVDANQVAVIWGGGTLIGNGTLKSPSVTNWGTISPGDDGIGVLTIDGNVTFQPGSVLEVDVNDSAIGDKLVVTGDVNVVGGTVSVLPTETITGTKDYTIIDANSITGALGVVDTALLDLTIADPNGGPFMLLRITAAEFDAGFGQTPNQQALGIALQTIAEAGGSPITAALQQLPTLDAVRTAYDQLSGQSRPPLAPILATDTAKFMGIVSNRLQGARGGVARDTQGLSDGPLLAMAQPVSGIGSPSDRSWDSFLWDLGPDTSHEGWGTWGKLYGLSGDRKTENGVTGYSYSVFGLSAGIEGQSSERSIWGVSLGRSDGQVDYDTLADKADLTTTHFGLYNTYSASGWYLNSVLIYSRIGVETERVVDLAGERLEGELDGREWGGYFEAGLDWQPAASWLVQPLAALQVTFLELGEYAEAGGASALAFEDQQYESYRVSLGAKLTKELVLGAQGRAAIVQARGRWVHELGDVLSEVEARFLNAPPAPFEVSDEETTRDSIMLGGGVGIRLTRGLRAFVDYDTSFNADKTVHVISGALDYRW